MSLSKETENKWQFFKVQYKKYYEVDAFHR